MLHQDLRSNLCGPLALEGVFSASGHYISAWDVYREATGCDYIPPGSPLTFSGLTQGALGAATLANIEIELFAGDGLIRDLATVDQAVRDGWRVIAGVWEGDLEASANFYHYIWLQAIEGDCYVVADPLYPTRRLVPVVDMHRSMVDNWTGPSGPDALAFQIAPHAP